MAYRAVLFHLLLGIELLFVVLSQKRKEVVALKEFYEVVGSFLFIVAGMFLTSIVLMLLGLIFSKKYREEWMIELHGIVVMLKKIIRNKFRPILMAIDYYVDIKKNLK